MPLLPKGIDRFAVASLLPALCLALGALAGGIWTVAAVFAISGLVFGLDRFVPEPAGAHSANSTYLSRAIGLVHIPLLFLCIWSIGRPDTSLTDAGLLILAAGLYFGQISNSNAHELIHRGDRTSQWLGLLCYASLMNGHHVSAHRLVHHVHAGTRKDPNTARLGEGFWRFVVRASIGAFVEGYRAERRRYTPGRHPYNTYLALAACSLLTAYGVGGAVGAAALLLISLHAIFQLLLSDYVQHYGLERRILADGTVEPMGDRHSWNAPHWYSAAMLLNAPRHSDHHTRPGKAFTDLSLDARTMPTLPQSLPVMCTLALSPTLWRKVMDPRVAHVTGQTHPDPNKSRAASRVLLEKGGIAGHSEGAFTGYAYETTRSYSALPSVPVSGRKSTDERV